jgi:Tol biopolymer transport system component
MMLPQVRSRSGALSRTALLLLVLGLAIVGSVPALADPGPGTPTTASKIVFHTTRYTSFEEICIMNPDGTDTTRLTFSSPYWSTCAALSPDGTRIAFESDRTYNLNHIYIMNVDGSGQHRVTTVSNEEAHATWSPSGTQMACSVIVGGAYEIYTMNANGTNRTRLTTSPGHDMLPDWSPDGTRILFTSARGGHYELYMMNANGTDQRRFIDTPNDTWSPKWSPDGTRIAYVTEIPSPLHYAIHVVNTDGTGDAAIRDTTWNNDQPDWAPDGSRIAFMSWEYGSTPEICTMLPDGSDVQRVTFGLTDNWSPSWGPTPATSAIAGLPSRAPGLYVSNPARARADLRLVMDQAAPASLELFDSAGRLVRTILREQGTLGTLNVSWDGRDDTGRPVGSGMYYFRFVLGEERRTTKLVFVR